MPGLSIRANASQISAAIKTLDTFGNSTSLERSGKQAIALSVLFLCQLISLTPANLRVNLRVNLRASHRLG